MPSSILYGYVNSWMRSNYCRLYCRQTHSVIYIYADNKQANNLCHEDLVTSGNMYFRTSYHYNKGEVEDVTVAIRYTHTSTNYSDATTKGLGPIKIRQFKPVLHGQELPNPLLRKC